MDLGTMFLQALKTGKMTHAYLITGGGAEALCEKAAEILLCEGEEKPCGRCKACLEHRAGANPDLLFVTPPEGKKIIAVESVRAMEEALSKAQVHGAFRPVVVKDAHRMNEKAQSALLKTLEEPPVGTVFLLTGMESGLLPTILSRCVVLRLKGGTAPADPAKGEALLLQAQKGRVPRELFPKDREELLELTASVCGACENRLKKGRQPGPLVQVVDLMDEAERRLGANCNQNLLVDWLIAKLWEIFAKREKA